MRRERSEHGAVAIMMALLTVILVGVVAFVTDFGVAYANKRALQNGVDAAVLAAGRRIVVNATPGETCEHLIEAATQTQAKADALATFNGNVGTGAGLAGGGVSIQCDDPALLDRVVISGTATMTSPAFFGGIFGQTSYDLSRSAKAVVAPAATLVGVRPFAICDHLAQLAVASPDSYLNLDFDNANLGCGTADGNFGTLDMRTPPPPGAPGSLVDTWVSQGYPGAIPAGAPLTLQGSPGIPASNLADDFGNILGQPIILPTYDVRTGSGSHSEYNITGFAEVKVCGLKLTSSAGSLQSGPCFQSSSAPTDPNTRFIQLKFVRFMPVGELDLTCHIAEDACDAGPKVVKLAQ